MLFAIVPTEEDANYYIDRRRRVDSSSTVRLIILCVANEYFFFFYDHGNPRSSQLISVGEGTESSEYDLRKKVYGFMAAIDVLH